MSALGHKRTSPVSSPKEEGRGLQYRLRPRNSSVDLESELLNNRRPESDVSGKGPAQFFRIRIENWFNAGVDYMPLLRYFCHRRAWRLSYLSNELDWRPRRCK